jgi:hypothetical protein
MIPLPALAELLDRPDVLEVWSVLAGQPVLVVDGDGEGPVPATLATLPCVKVVVSAGQAGSLDGRPFDLLLTSDAALASRPGWVLVPSIEEAVTLVTSRVEAQPRAAVALVALLRLTETLPVWEAVVAESAVYSMLLGSEAFWAWREATPRRDAPAPEPDGAVVVSRQGATLLVELNRPKARNAVDETLRDGLVGAMQLAAAADDVTKVVLTGRGQAFSAGGDLNEFGTVKDPALANAVRLTRHPGYAVALVADKVEARIHGAAMGSGIEIPAFARRVVARTDAVFGLPELGMGLVPGAGGTVSVTKRVGRHRANWIIVSGERIDATTAQAWGLVDDVVESW